MKDIKDRSFPKKGDLFIHGDDEPELVVPLKNTSDIFKNTKFTEEQIDKLKLAFEKALKEGKDIKINLQGKKE